MKKIMAFVVFFVSMNVLAQRKDSKLEEIARLQNTPTAIGKPDGEPVSKKIGKNGGTLVSSDNKMTLIIPAGALSSETLISIQPSTNFAKESMGKAYQLEPSGIKFQKPAQLIFTYSEKELDGQSPELMGVGWQNDKGVWKGLRKINLDKNSKTITADINHFSGFVLWWAVILEPEKTRIKVSDEMYVFFYERDLEDAPYADPSEEILNPRAFTSNKNWSVNEIPGGNSDVGHIQALAGAPATVHDRLYKAPAQVPNDNPVEIKVEITDIKLINPNPKYANETYPNTTRKCNVLIFDNAYEVFMESIIKGGSRESWGGVISHVDAGQFTVELGKYPPTLTHIYNYLEMMNIDCRIIISNPTTCTGMIHVAGTTEIKVTPANPPGEPYPIVEIWFVPFPIELTRFTFNCPPPPSKKGHSKGKVDLSQMPMMTMYGMPTLPIYLKFVAKDEEQVLIEKGRQGDPLWYKFRVRKVKEE